MTRHEAAKKAIELFERGYTIESEIHYIDTTDGEEKKSRLMSRPAGDCKWSIIYTRNDRGVFTASDVKLFDAHTEFHEAHKRRDLSYEVFDIRGAGTYPMRAGW